MLATLGVGEIGAIILVHRETETAFEGADVILEEVGVLVQVDGFEGEFAESFSSVGVGGGVRCHPSAAEFGARSVLVEESVSIWIGVEDWVPVGMGT